MTRAEFLRKHASDSCEGDDVRIDLDALLAAARAEALEDALARCEAQRQAWEHLETGEQACRSCIGEIRALVRPLSAAMTWCELCGACFRCGVRDVAMSVTAHECGKAPVILATGPTHPGYVHSTNLRVEGREAPRREGRATQLPTPSAYGDDGEMADPVEVVTDPAPDLEACARAAYEARAHHEGNPDPWEHYVGEDQREMWREVARAVLAAAGVTR